jgi:hypothetical protein
MQGEFGRREGGKAWQELGARLAGGNWVFETRFTQSVNSVSSVVKARVFICADRLISIAPPKRFKRFSYSDCQN